MEQLPHVPQELLAYLKKIYPLRMPKVSETEREIFVRVGHHDVIRTLEKLAADQEKRQLLGTRN